MNIWMVISLGLLSLSSTQGMFFISALQPLYFPVSTNLSLPAALSTENFSGCSGNSLCGSELLSDAKPARVVPPPVSPPSNCSAIGLKAPW